ncbi:MAG: hypothetical protein KC636_23595 [Myxococcales bacterium]|nr:hypothetical protein [Myxococcales bacterium]
MDRDDARGSGRGCGLRRVGVALGLGLLTITCGTGEPPLAALDELRLPSGALLTPDGGWLFVTNSNLDREEESSALVVLDVARLEQAIAKADGDALPTAERPCRQGVDHVECAARFFLDPERSRRLPSGAGNIALDRPFGEAGPLRLMIPSRLDPSVTWLDVDVGTDGPAIDCGEDGERRCDDAHTLRRFKNNPSGNLMPSEPARLVVGAPGTRYALLPQLLGQGLSVIALDGPEGPALINTDGDFFLEDPYVDGRFGGFSVAQRGCDPGAPVTGSQDCAWPYFYATHRYQPAIGALALDNFGFVRSLGNYGLLDLNVYSVQDRPFTGDLAFEDSAAQERLLVVHTTPPGLARVDTRLGADMRPRNEVTHSVSLCRNPNVLAIDRPLDREPTAYVSCFGDDQVAAVALAAFVVVATIPVGDGPNELVIDPGRRWLYVVNTPEESISIVELDHSSPQRHTEIARIGRYE